MDHPENEPKQEEVEKIERLEDEVALEDLDIPDDLKAELLRELDGFKEGDGTRGRGAPPRRP